MHKHEYQTKCILQEFFSPLESPAIAPTYDRNNQPYTHVSMQSCINEATFSPLTSPALHAMPQPYHGNSSSNNNFEQQPPAAGAGSEQSPESILQQKLAMIERQQQQLRSAHWQLQGSNAGASVNSTSSGAVVSGVASNATQESMQQTQLITNSPHVTATAINSANNSNMAVSQPQPKETGFIAPATPSLLMKLGGGGGTAPNLPGNHSAAVDNMASLPAAIIQDKSTTTGNNTSFKKTTGSKRRRVTRSSAAFTSPGLAPTAHVSPRFPPTDPTIAALVSPAALRPHVPVSSSPRALKPLISPSLQPNGKRLSAIEEQAAVAALATKSNYQNMREGKAKSLGIDFSSSFQSGIENRRSAHKAAEQKRRDTLKQSFDALRKEIADAVLDPEESSSNNDNNNNNNNNGNKSDAGSSEDSKEQKDKAVKQMSKVTLIQHAYEYIVRLKSENRRKDNEMAKLREQVRLLQSQLNDQPTRNTNNS